MQHEVGWFGKAAAMALVAGLALAANAGSWVVHVRMPDNTVITLEMASVPNPDSAGMYRLHTKDRGELVVHASNVWIFEKSHRGKARK